MISSADHNRLATEFVTKVASQTRSDAEMMVVIESVILATMLVLHKREGLQRAAAAAMVDTALQVAMERFCEEAAASRR